MKLSPATQLTRVAQNAAHGYTWMRTCRLILVFWLIVSQLLGQAVPRDTAHAFARAGAQPGSSISDLPSAPATPDLTLTVGDMIFTPAAPTAGTSADLAITVHNTGPTAAAAASLVVTDTFVVSNAGNAAL